MNVQELYQQKLTTAEEAVKIVKSGDWVDYGWCCNQPVALDKALAQVPTALGFNNHMGSGFTGRRDACRMLAGLAYGRGLFVLDSVTRGNSQLETSMVRQGIVTASRHVFLDDPQGTDKVLAALDKAARLARKQGIAIAIGHPHASTLRALERWENREGVAVVPLRRYVWHLAQLRAGQFGKPE